MRAGHTVKIVASVLSALVITAVMAGWATTGPTPTVAAALAAVNSLPPTPDTAWGLDPTTGRLVVTVSEAAPQQGADRLLALARRLGAAVRVVRIDHTLSEQTLVAPRATNGLLLGGDELTDGHIICSAGFNVVKLGQPFVITAGHCTAGLRTWQEVGPSVSSAFPKTDYGLIREDDTLARGDVDLYDGTFQPITEVGVATVGEHVCASGQTTGVTCGEVTAVHQTVDYGNGDVVNDLIATNVHTDHGDSGGSLFDGPIGIGTVSGGDGTTDYFQPLGPVMSANGLELATP